jgi:hypothetical protein
LFDALGDRWGDIPTIFRVDVLFVLLEIKALQHKEKYILGIFIYNFRFWLKICIFPKNIKKIGI